MGRRNHVKGRRPQARRKDPEQTYIVPKVRRQLAPAISDAVTPHGRCSLPHRKMKFHAHEADLALKQAQALRRSRGQEAHMEVRHYACDACGASHLTSRQEYRSR